MRQTLALSFVIGTLLVSGTAFAGKAGEITLLSGRATAATPEGAIRNLNKGDPVFSREYISTSPGAFVNVKFLDGGAILIKPNSRFQIENYAYGTPTPAKTENGTNAPVAPRGSVALFGLIKGGFRAISGLIGKKDRGEYRITTPVATIGIRGTDYEAVLCDDACAKDPIIQENVGITTAPQNGLVAGVLEGSIGVTKKISVAMSLRDYRNIASALGPEPAGLMKAAYRPGLLRKVVAVNEPHIIYKGQTYFFSAQPGQKPIKLPDMNPNIDGGLSGYNPKDICK